MEATTAMVAVGIAGIIPLIVFAVLIWRKRKL
jgi:hypothetical protein